MRCKDIHSMQSDGRDSIVAQHISPRVPDMLFDLARHDPDQHQLDTTATAFEVQICTSSEHGTSRKSSHDSRQNFALVC